MSLEFKMIKVKQPIGEFYIGKIEGTELKELVEEGKIDIKPRKRGEEGGTQRGLSLSRAKEISEYTGDEDATFPTPIIIAIDAESILHLKEDSNGIIDLKFIDGAKYIGEIIDGQHRVKGLIASSNVEKFQMTVVFMIGATLEEKAYVFSIINSTQTKVSPSLIYDLYGEMSGRSPHKTCHEIARLMNRDKNAPYYRNLKMLGKSEEPTESLSQGTFVKHLLNLISKKPDEDRINLQKRIDLSDFKEMPLRRFFIEERDEVIYKLICNVFAGLKNNYKSDWEGSILTKTVVYCAVMKSFNRLYEIGEERKELTVEFFEKGFKKLGEVIGNKEGMVGMKEIEKFTIFKTGAASVSKLSSYIVEAFEIVYCGREENNI